MPPDTLHDPSGSVWTGPDSDIHDMNQQVIRQLGEALGLSPHELVQFIELTKSEMSESLDSKHTLTLLKLIQAAHARGARLSITLTFPDREVAIPH